MMKFLFLILFFFIMLLFNKKIMFFYNMCYLLSFFFLFNFMFKDSIWINITYIFGFDLYSFGMIILSFWIIGLMFMVIQLEENFVYEDYIKKLLMFLLMLIILLLFFSSLNLMLFYLMFELSLIPTFIIIIYWGMNFERLSSSYYLLLYTMFISLPLLIYIMKVFKIINTLDFMMLIMYLDMKLGLWDYLILFMAFYIKMPMYLFHIWLPKAHVEAPVYGSMILAAILLKLGGYGMIRFMFLFYKNMLKYNYMIFSVCILGAFITSLICLIQIDMKSLVAYSSVVHMNMMMCSLLTMMKVGLLSSYILMISHGLCSSGLFFMVNLYYERSGSRLMFLNKGMMNLLPSLSLLWFLLCSANFSFPLSLNFISEVYLISVIISWNFMMMFLLMLICFISSAYSLYLYSFIQHGYNYYENKVYIIYLKDYMILIIHLIPLIMMIFNLIFFF